ncbi:MAG: FecR domain-containing protein [Gilvibacter sp.]
MEKKNLLDRWLDHSLSEEERTLLQDDERFRAFETITQAAQYFRSPELDASSSYDRLLNTIETKKKKTNWRKYAVNIAAVLVIGFLTYTTIFSSSNGNYSADFGEKIAINLPGDSQVLLNAKSNLMYSNENWSDERNVAMQGEAYFNVTEGAPFIVTSLFGSITTTGAKFNVSHHSKNYLAVACYEGTIEVAIGNMNYTLNKGEQLSLINSKLVREDIAAPNPTWINNKSYFKSTPLTFILDELARQYELELETESIDKSVIFTGSFTHQDLDTALQSITIPLKLSYTIDGTKVRLVNDDE